jgi:formate-dependent nitrite reductase membrane component NrfD
VSEAQSYYGRPILKEPVWKPEIPLYFFTGGLAGASSVLSGVARLLGRGPLAKASLYIGAAADLASPALLISDLGRPERFLNMFRVFKVTSPMSVGSWVLGASSGSSVTAALLELAGGLKRVKYAAEAVSMLTGAPLAVYTAALVSDTAIPVWHEARRELPFIFAASSSAAAGAAATLVLSPEDAAPARRLAVGGVVAEGTAFALMQARLGMLGEPYRQGEAGRLAAIARGCSAAGASLLALRGRKSHAAARAGSALVLAGGLALRFSVFKAGFQSARDPKYVVAHQRGRSAGSTAR